jgi:hypothetical protein
MLPKASAITVEVVTAPAFPAQWKLASADVFCSYCTVLSFFTILVLFAYGASRRFHRFSSCASWLACAAHVTYTRYRW